MAKKAQEGGVNKSQAIRDLLKENPQIKAGEAIATLGKKGITVKNNLFYFVKGSLEGQKNRRKKNKQTAVTIATASTHGSTTTTPAAAKSDALATIRKIKVLAGEVGGLRTLKGL